MNIPVMRHESLPRWDVIHTQSSITMIMYIVMRLFHRCVKRI